MRIITRRVLRLHRCHFWLDVKQQKWSSLSSIGCLLLLRMSNLDDKAKDAGKKMEGQARDTGTEAKKDTKEKAEDVL